MQKASRRSSWSRTAATSAASDEFLRVTTRAQLIVENFGVVSAATGGEIDRQMGLFLEASGELG